MYLDDKNLYKEYEFITDLNSDEAEITESVQEFFRNQGKQWVGIILFQKAFCFLYIVVYIILLF